ncbi:hypothetical protein FKP32DRAFT_1558752 [Trametes sanguinea]|nr:hypothetical protein FKP32DRAFT_1558752 [Trametes sanguinea]
MASHADAEPPLLPEKGVRYSVPSAHIQTSPHKFGKLANHDTRKHGNSLKPNAAIDRPLLGASSMGHTVLVDFNTFEKDVLNVRPSLQAIAAPPRKLVAGAKKPLNWLFRPGASPTEELIAETFIGLVNTEGLLKRHRAAFTGNKASRDGCTAKVDAGIYPQQHTPAAGNPDWTHIRLFIEFKRQGTSLDPFDDDDPRAPEAHAQTRTAVRNQILDYARVVNEYQHRVCIYGLFVIGPEFRLMRFDHSGVIVTKKQNYAQDPAPLLSFLAWFDSLTDAGQGLDPTAVLLKKGSRAYRLMTDFSKKQQSDLRHKEGYRVSATAPQPVAPSAPPEPDAPARHTRQQTKAAAAISQEDESYLDDVELLDEDPRVFKYVRKQFRKSLKHNWPRYKIEVGEGKEKRIFLVGKPVWTAFWLFGRGTRGYVAFLVKTRRFVFLKDCWRPFYEGVEPEGRYLELLAEEALKAPDIRVPTVIAHGDVAKQRTQTASLAQRWAAEAKRAFHASRKAHPSIPSTSRAHGVKRGRAATDDPGVGSRHDSAAEGLDGDSNAGTEYRVYSHYRIVFKDVCLPFTSVRSSKQLVTCLYQCITTHSLAYTKLRLLHSDISAGNVIIMPALSSKVDAEGKKKVTWTGILTDWELAKFVPKPGASGKQKETPRQPERTGTWQFMSVAYIRHHPRQPVSVADELESFFHVLLFYAVRLLHHNVPNVPFFVSNYFDSFTVADDARRDCSDAKATAMRLGEVELSGGSLLNFMRADASVSHEYLNDLLARMLRCFQARYAILAWEKKQLETPMPSRPKPSASIPSPTSSNLARPPPRDPDNNEDLLNRPKLEPTPADRKIAKRLDSHVEFLNLFWEELQHDDWPEDDVVGDRLPENYDPRELILALEKMCAASFMRTTGINEDLKDAPARKKARTEASEPIASSTTMLHPQARIAGTSLVDSIVTGKPVKGKGRARALFRN